MTLLDIRSRMLLAALLPLVLVSTLLAFVFLLARFDDMQESYQQRNRSVARQIAMASEYGLFSANVVQLQALAAGALNENDVRWVGIVDGRGQTLVSAGERAVSVHAAMGPLETQGFDAVRRIDWLSQPVRSSRMQLDDLFEKRLMTDDKGAPLLGQVVVVFSRQSVDVRKRDMLAVGGLIGLAGLVFGMLLAAYLSRGVLRPIGRINQLVERIGQGDFAGVEHLRGQNLATDPLQDLRVHIFRMADRLALARDELESQVQLATAALREKKNEAELANLAKSRFLAAASHDLRQPTHALGLFVARLAQLPHDEQSGKLIKNLESSVRAMQNLLDGLLDISRLEARAVQVNKRPFALSALFDQLAQDLGPDAQERRLQLRLRPTDVWVMSDATLVYRMLLNLVGNALRYTERGGVLVVARRTACEQVLLQVWDTGIGIAPEHQQAVFTEFFQVANPARDRTKGLGLGLNIVQRTAGLLKHPLQMVSELGRGTRFSLTLPLAQSQAEALPTPSIDRTSADDLRGLSVLVIEDDALARAALVDLLASWGMQVLQANDMHSALQHLSDGARPAVIVSDYRLSEGHDGMALVQSLRVRMGQDTPAFLISGDTDPALIQRAQAAHLTLLHKPVRPAKLRTLLRRLVLDQRADDSGLS